MKIYMRLQLKALARDLGIVYILPLPAARAQSPRPPQPKGRTRWVYSAVVAVVAGRDRLCKYRRRGIDVRAGLDRMRAPLVAL